MIPKGSVTFVVVYMLHTVGSILYRTSVCQRRTLRSLLLRCEAIFLNIDGG
jgi:hypothetical protein